MINGSGNHCATDVNDKCDGIEFKNILNQSMLNMENVIASETKQLLHKLFNYYV